MSTDQTERVGINAVEAVFLKGFEWAFREQPVSDFGIDAQVEVVEDKRPTGKLIALQIKSGSSYFRKSGADYIFYGDTRHLDYWTKHSLPVFLILHNPEDGMILWQKIERRLAHVTDSGWSIKVPSENVLTKEARPYFENGIARDDESIRRFEFAVNLDTMKLFDERDAVYFRLDRWVNKTLSVRGIQVYFDEPYKDEPDMEFSHWAAGYSNHELMQRWFPWLQYEYADEVEDIAGEIERHIYLVSLNEHAKRFMALEGFLQTGEPSQPDPDEIDYDDREATLEDEDHA